MIINKEHTHTKIGMHVHTLFSLLTFGEKREKTLPARIQKEGELRELNMNRLRLPACLHALDRPAVSATTLFFFSIFFGPPWVQRALSHRTSSIAVAYKVVKDKCTKNGDRFLMIIT